MNDTVRRSDDLTAEELTEMLKYDIARVPVYFYQAGAYRYANLKNAIEQAKREASRAGTHE